MDKARNGVFIAEEKMSGNMLKLLGGKIDRNVGWIIDVDLNIWLKWHSWSTTPVVNSKGDFMDKVMKRGLVLKR